MTYFHLDKFARQVYKLILTNIINIKMLNMKNDKAKGLVIVISAMFFIVVFCGGAVSNNDYEDYEKYYIRYTSGPPSKPLEYDDVIQQSRIRIHVSSVYEML